MMIENYKIFKLQGWNLNNFFTGGKPEITNITGVKHILTLIN